MKINLIILLAGMIAVRAFAADTSSQIRTVATCDFTGDSETRNYASKISALVTVNLASDTNLAMVDRTELNKALEEQSLGASGLVSLNAAAKIGQITGTKILVSGQVMMMEENHLIIIANMIGTENGRLFAVKVEGPANNLVELTASLSSKIAQTIIDQTTNLVTAAKESNTARIERIVKSISGTNRPTVSVNFYHSHGPSSPSFTGNTEMGVILQRAGFQIVDEKSERKPDIEISGVVGVDGLVRESLHIEHAVVEMTVQERQTGLILVMDRQESAATDASQSGAQRSAQALAIDELAERLLPKLAK